MKTGTTLIAATLLLAGCTGTKLGLLPDAGDATKVGKVAAINLVTGEDIAVIDQGNSVARIGAETVSVRALSSEKMASRYADLFASMPLEPRRFILNFQTGGAELTPEAELEIPKLLDEVKSRPGVDVQIVGHTDRVGGEEGNDRISIARAETLKARLAERGIPAEVIRATGRGEREPLERPDEDEFDSATNRRAEVLVK